MGPGTCRNSFRLARNGSADVLGRTERDGDLCFAGLRTAAQGDPTRAIARWAPFLHDVNGGEFLDHHGQYHDPREYMQHGVTD